MQCRDFREVADSYLNDELLVETNHDMIAHLEACSDCRRELAARRELRATLRASFANAEDLRLRDQFADQLGTRLRATATGQARSLASHRVVWMAIAASLLVIATIGWIALKQWQRTQTPPQTAAVERRESDIGHVNSSKAPSPRTDAVVPPNLVPDKLSQLAAGDHHDCAIGHRLPERPIDLEEAGRKYDRAYLDLKKAVMSRLNESSEAIDLVAAHWCVFNGQSFAHIVLRHRGRLASLLVTKLERADQLAPQGSEIDPHNQVITCAKDQGFQISCFRTPGHAVFVVSDLDETENLALAREMAPSVYEHITRAEEVT